MHFELSADQRGARVPFWEFPESAPSCLVYGECHVNLKCVGEVIYFRPEIRCRCGGRRSAVDPCMAGRIHWYCTTISKKIKYNFHFFVK